MESGGGSEAGRAREQAALLISVSKPQLARGTIEAADGIQQNLPIDAVGKRLGSSSMVTALMAHSDAGIDRSATKFRNFSGREGRGFCMSALAAENHSQRRIGGSNPSLSAISVFDMSILNGLSGKLANLSLRFATQCSRFELLATVLG